MKKVTVEAKVTMTINMNDDADFDDVVSSLFVQTNDDSADVEDAQFEDVRVTDSR